MAKAEKTRTRILDAAARQFRQKGYAAVSLRSIAAAEKMKGGSLYYHFSSKDEIVSEVLNIGIEMVQQAVESAVSALPDDAGHDRIIRTAIRAHLQAFLEHSDYTSANVRIFGQLPKPVQNSNLKARADYEDCWRRILGNAERDGALTPGTDLNVVRLMLLGAMNATLEWFDPKQGSVDKLADRFAEMVLRGISRGNGRQIRELSE